MYKLKIIMCVLALLAASVFWGYSQDKPARVIAVKGDVKVVPQDSNIGKACVPDMVLNRGDWVKTGNGAMVSIAFDDNMDNVVRISENSIVIIKMDGYLKIQLLTGELYAILEDVESNDSFKVLTPSVLTEAMSSGWGVKSDGTYTNVVVFDNKVFICGVNKDGTVKDEKFWIKEGYQRKTIKFEDPGELVKAPEDLVDWFKKQVLAHHLEKSLARKRRATQGGPDTEAVAGEEAEAVGSIGEATRSVSRVTQSGKTIIIDGEEINLIDYLYNKRLEKSKGSKNMLRVEE